jgi:hypothetical protein
MAQHEDAAVDAPYDTDSAAAAISDLLNDSGDIAEEDDDEELPEGDEPEGDEVDEEGDEPEDEADEDDEDEEPQEAAIPAPASLNAEEKAAWAQLPPEAQQTIAAIESRRTTEVQNGLAQARNAQRDAESAAASRVADAQRLFAEQQADIAQRYAPKEPSEQDFPDWGSFSRAKAQYNHRAAQHQDLMQQLGDLHSEAVVEQQRLDGESLQHEWAAVKGDLPEAADPALWQELQTRLTPVALELGYPDELLADATPTDMRAIKRAAAWKEKAEKYDSLMSRKMSKVRSGSKTAKPNAAQPLGSGKARANAKATQRLQRSGSVEDAAAALIGRL